MKSQSIEPALSVETVNTATSLAASETRGFEMKYILIIAGDESWMTEQTEEEQIGVLRTHQALVAELQALNQYVDGGGLMLRETAVTVRRAEDGSTTVTDGPYAETKESVGGYYVIEAASREEAIGWAERIPSYKASIEVREVYSGPPPRDASD